MKILSDASSEDDPGKKIEEDFENLAETGEETMSYCICESKGFCSKHLCYKTQRDFELCKGIRISDHHRDKYRKAWEEGRGYAQRDLNNNKSKAIITHELEPTTINQRASSEGPGTELIRIYQDAGMPPCKACKDLAATMDRIGISQCEKTIDKIVEDILPRAKSWIATNRPWIHRLLPGVVEDAGIKAKIKMDVHLAIQNAKKAKEIKRKREKRTNKKYKGPQDLKLSKPDPFEFPGTPHTTLLFHLYPLRETFEYHVDKLKKLSHSFDRKILGVACDKSSMTFDEIKSAFGTEWEYVTVDNNPKLREVATYSKMISMLDFNDPNHVTFCAHGKGAQSHTIKSDSIDWWTSAMYETVLNNLEGVLGEFRKGYQITGSFRRLGGNLGTKYRWHYSGAFYAFKNDFFKDKKIPQYRNRWWGTESWPGDNFGINVSSVIFNQNTKSGDLYNINDQPRKELEKWRDNLFN
jgi:hypothetical protein